MHLETRDAHKETGTAKLLLFVVIAQHMTNVLAKKTLYAFAKLLHAIDFALIHLPLTVRPRCERRDLLVNAIVPRDVGNQILEPWERLHRLYCDWLTYRQRIPSRLARQCRA